MSFRSARFLALWVLLLSAVSWADDAADFTSVDTWIESRDTSIPVTLVTPTPASTQAVPLVTLIHGHGGTRHEAGGYTRVAEGLARLGIASVRMDFPGCGDSTETFANNNLTNMLADIRAAQQFARARIEVDESRLGLQGFSMGGRLAITLAAEEKHYRAMGLWAPAATDGAGNMQTYLGGPEAYDAMKARAKAEGYAPWTTFWGQEQKLGYRWFTDLETSMPGRDIGQFTGNLFVLYGDLDDVVKPAISDRVIHLAKNATSVHKHVVQGADHGLGLFNDDWDRSEEAVSTTITFFAENL